MDVLGQSEATVRYDNRELAVNFIVINEDVESVIGWRTALHELQLIKKMFSMERMQNPVQSRWTSNKLLEEYPQVFKGVGCMDDKYKIKLRSNAVPKIQPPRKVPFGAYKLLRDELDRLLNTGKIAKVDEATEWISNVSIAWKRNGTMRLCLDPRELNKNIVREYYHIPTVEEIRTATNGAAVFSTFDATEGFHQVQLDEESSLLTTFHTPFGRFRWLRLPFGISSAPEVYQKHLQNAVTNHVTNAENFIDDIVVWGKTIEEHDIAVQNLMERCKEANVTLNPKKSMVGVSEICYLGEILSKEGIKADPRKIKGIEELVKPDMEHTVTGKRDQLRRFLGSVTYLSKFCPN